MYRNIHVSIHARTNRKHGLEQHDIHYTPTEQTLLVIYSHFQRDFVNDSKWKPYCFTFVITRVQVPDWSSICGAVSSHLPVSPDHPVSLSDRAGWITWKTKADWSPRSTDGEHPVLLDNTQNVHMITLCPILFNLFFNSKCIVLQAKCVSQPGKTNNTNMNTSSNL